MKPIILTLAILALLVLNTNAQNFTKYFNRGVELYDSNKYYLAYKQFDASRKVAVVEKNTSNINTAQTWIDKAVAGIEAKMRASDSLAIVASEEKEKALAALTKAELMQTKVETAMFDKAVKERNSEWKGYTNYTSETDRAEILDLIDTLDLSENALLRIPKEVTECQNLKHINLLGNDDIDWNASSETLSKLSSEVGIYVSVYDLDSIPSDYWSFVTGIEMLTNELTEISENILMQTQLTYLDLSYDYLKDNKFSNLNEIYKLTNLKYLYLSYCRIDTLSSEIGNLSNLIWLDLSDNNLTELPIEISKLLNLTGLVLRGNELTKIQKEIQYLTNLTYLSLNSNDLTELPKEIRHLKNLTYLSLSSNDLTELPKEIGCLLGLTVLNSCNNKLIELPIEIGKLINLTDLNLENNKLTILPKQIKNLLNLKSLRLTGNPITEKEINNVKFILPSLNISYIPFHLYFFYKNKYKVVNDYYTNQIKDTSGLSIVDKYCFANSFNYEGNGFFKSSKIDSALLYYQKSIEIEPDFFLGWYNLGNSYLNNNEYEKALFYYEKAIEIDTLSIDAIGKIIPCYLYTKQFERAEYYAKKAISINPGGNYYYLSLARAYLFQGKLDEAKEIYLKFKEVQMDEIETGKQASLRQLKAMEEAGVIPEEYLPDVEKIKALLNE